jgi:4-hydroxythreonine-4-phosphate dehydrogenase
MSLPLGISMGDPAGVGPEVILAALARGPLGFDVRVYADRGLLEERAARFGWPLPADLVQACRLAPGACPPGRFSPAGGLAQVACLEAAVADLAAGRLAGLVTGPIHKRALQEAGLPGPGQTEFLAARLGAPLPVMMLCSPRLKVVLATTHLPLREVPAALTRSGLVQLVRVAADDLTRYFHPGGARLGLAALNPHGEERGRPGREEREVLAPAVAELRALGVAIEGPLAADGLMAQAVAGRFDVVVALYHDQGLGPLKALDFHAGVNVTLGLGRVRTSPDHGPAYDLAGTGRADPGSTRAALELAARMAALREVGPESAGAGP